jgi:hypothetical protein
VASEDHLWYKSPYNTFQELLDVFDDMAHKGESYMLDAQLQVPFNRQTVVSEARLTADKGDEHCCSRVVGCFMPSSACICCT